MGRIDGFAEDILLKKEAEEYLGIALKTGQGTLGNYGDFYFAIQGGILQIVIRSNAITYSDNTRLMRFELNTTSGSFPTFATEVMRDVLVSVSGKNEYGAEDMFVVPSYLDIETWTLIVPIDGFYFPNDFYINGEITLLNVPLEKG